MTCGSVAADDAAPDGFMAFNVSGGAAKDVAIDMQGSTLEAVYELRRSNGTLVSCGVKESGSETTIKNRSRPAATT